MVEGIRTKKMVADPVAADHVRLMFEMYAEPETSFGDITRYRAGCRWQFSSTVTLCCDATPLLPAQPTQVIGEGIRSDRSTGVQSQIHGDHCGLRQLSWQMRHGTTDKY